ncbi:hypothetical protein BGX26_000563 [Mortierella sp. AD094]|nr:hypothetical protein BGX26_000563 [Mortierella sp. AD094]
MSTQMPEDKPVLEVLIVGAGISGLALAILLEQINVPYQIFERASEVKPLGSAISLSGDIFPALEQLGIYEELKKVSKPYDEVEFYTGDLKKIGGFNTKEHKIASGYPNRMFTGPDFYEILRKRVPAHKVNFKKKVLRIEEEDDKVTIYCSDRTSYTGDILVGADGTYSGVRQSMYRHMDGKGILPKSDLENYSIGYTTIVGIATPSYTEKYSRLNEEGTILQQILYEGGGNCYVVPTQNNQVCWGFGVQLPETELKEMSFRYSEWSLESNGSIDSALTAHKDFPCPLGGTMGELFDATPKEMISKIFLEEKVFKTWYHGRTVLLGDACHKFHPAGGKGARNAIQDAIVLANCIYGMTDSAPKSISTVFKVYYKLRYHRNERDYTESAAMSKVLNGQKWLDRLFRNVFLNYLPGSILRRHMRTAIAYRPQVAWLPQVENRGNGPVLPQEFRKSDSTNAVSV